MTIFDYFQPEKTGEFVYPGTIENLALHITLYSVNSV